MKDKKIQILLPILIMFIMVFLLNNKNHDINKNNIENLYISKASGKFVEFKATVENILNDDLKGDKHQRLILRISPKRTVLLAHNIDVAPRVPVKIRDSVLVKGQYEWNEKGGVVHWTHKKDNNPYGWILHKNKKYQ
ncbi:MAG: DUF3465 domain-containing protein [Marinicellaceae bacterium]